MNSQRHQYETARLTILWHGVVQPLGFFRTWNEALEVIHNVDVWLPQEGWAIRTPEGDIPIDLKTEAHIRAIEDAAAARFTAEMQRYDPDYIPGGDETKALSRVAELHYPTI